MLHGHKRNIIKLTRLEGYCAPRSPQPPHARLPNKSAALSRAPELRRDPLLLASFFKIQFYDKDPCTLLTYLHIFINNLNFNEEFSYYDRR